MSKGGWTQDTKVISVRVPTTVYSVIVDRAKVYHMSVGDWVKVKIGGQHIKIDGREWKPDIPTVNSML